MKYSIAILLAVMFTFAIFPSFAETDKEIIALNNPWLSTPKQVKDTMINNGYSDIPDQQYGQAPWFEWTMKDDRVGYYNLPNITLTYSNPQYYYRIADLNVDKIRCDFSAPIKENGDTHYSDDDYLLYRIAYDFAVDTEEDVLSKFDQLLTKLTYLYGEPDEIQTNDGSYSNLNHQIVYWHGANHTRLELRCSVKYSFVRSLTLEYGYHDLEYFAQYENTEGLEYFPVGEVNGL